MEGMVSKDGRGAGKVLRACMVVDCMVIMGWNCAMQRIFMAWRVGCVERLALQGRGVDDDAKIATTDVLSRAKKLMVYL